MIKNSFPRTNDAHCALHKKKKICIQRVPEEEREEYQNSIGAVIACLGALLRTKTTYIIII